MNIKKIKTKEYKIINSGLLLIFQYKFYIPFGGERFLVSIQSAFLSD